MPIVDWPARMYLMVLSEKHKGSISKPVALVTGAASPLGTAICFKLAEQGIRLGLHFGKSQENTLKLQEELNRFGIETIVLKADLRKSSQLKQIIGHITRKWGRLGPFDK